MERLELGCRAGVADGDDGADDDAERTVPFSIGLIRPPGIRPPVSSLINASRMVMAADPVPSASMSEAIASR